MASVENQFTWKWLLNKDFYQDVGAISVKTKGTVENEWDGTSAINDKFNDELAAIIWSKDTVEAPHYIFTFNQANGDILDMT